MEEKHKIPYGVINWAKLVRECLFVDNTAYIRPLEKVDTPVFLRPKRFGKSVVCSRGALVAVAAFLFACVAHGDIRSIRVSEKDCRYLEYSDGKAYIPIGINWCWPSFEWDSQDPERTLATFERQLRKFASFGGNFIRIWVSCDFFEPEVSEGVYDEDRAKRLDRVLAVCRDLDIRAKLCLMHARRLVGKTPDHGVVGKHYERRFYDKRNGGSFGNMREYIASPAGQDLYRRRLEFYAKRYAQEPAVLAIELWNEMDCVCGIELSMEWSAKMLKETQRLFPGKLALQSFGSFCGKGQIKPYSDFWRLEGNAIAQIHRYNLPTFGMSGVYGPQDVSVASAVEFVRDEVRPNKPILLAETGVAKAKWEGISPLHGLDKEGVILHDSLFAPFFAGACGPGHIWYWDTYVERNDVWYHFGRFTAAVRGFDPIAESPRTLRNDTEALRVWTLAGRKTLLAYCRDKTSDIYSEFRDGIPARELSGMTVVLPTGSATKASVYEPFADRWTDVPVEAGKVTLPRFKRAAVVKVAVDDDPPHPQPSRERRLRTGIEGMAPATLTEM